MADEDEIDVLGDFSLDNILTNDGTIFDTTSLVSQNSDILNCDYTIHPQWLLDKPSTNPALWYNNTTDGDLELTKQYEFEPHITTENSITDESGWTEKEKNLLNRGIEIFGKSNLNLSQFIGSRTPAEVRYFLKNFYSDVELSYTPLNDDSQCVEETIESSFLADDTDQILEDSEIPASIEEVIAAVSTAKPTVPNNKKCVNPKKKSSKLINYASIPSGQSLLRSNYVKSKEVKKKILTNSNKKSVKFKFKTKLKVMDSRKNCPSGKPLKAMNYKPIRRRSTKSETESVKSESSDVQIVTGNGLAVPVCEGEEVIKIRKEHDTENSDSDIEIDVEDSDDETSKKVVIKQEDTAVVKENIKSENKEIKTCTPIESKSMKQVSNDTKKKIPELKDLDKNVADELLTMNEPSSEIVLNSEISEVEKFIFAEYFEGRTVKTPARYLKIRNYIINAWNTSKPNYVKKTAIRNGLKQCGDVNCIGRIHYYLEQIGAINFGCEQTKYYRPLYDMVNVLPVVREKSESAVPIQKVDFPRQRKKKFVNDGEGGYTLTHDERGDIINTTVVNEEPATKQRTYIKKPQIRLIYCRAFNDEVKQQYTVRLNLSALILMDLHAHMHLTEVMGLIGGNWNSQQRVLSIVRYEPCKNIASSSTHCDMCPISQARAADYLHDDNLDILGWYHSHPTFAPEPSQQDLETQLSVQQWIGNKKPCIGFILSPFSLHGALIASPYRCLIVDRKENFEDQFVPYKLKVELVTDELDVEDLTIKAKRVLETESSATGKSQVDFTKTYFQDNSITYLDKFIYSVKMHLAKCSGINKMTCDAITNNLSELCNSKLHCSNNR
ncbi:PREDICTED: histone H2A deubiquitinase MYSM1-like [Nicrophorus vespilloides]|uniref:Myb-like, SWIRM and MPN domain-containing protein 1 n=1 Tax=Nicrophorus vespilloides TaxID=110193 RepID=A0ABM1MUH5_NICVS|nr:PREDICTED: histone H2A deubiquitinase MYSM1-like [Nicrophorus vespilloides]